MGSGDVGPMNAVVRRTANLLVVLLAAVCVTVGGWDSAAAHFAGGREPSNWRGEILSVEPAMAGVTFALTDSADRIEVRNTSSTPVIIYGYQHKEPGDRDRYLKVSADGVWVNAESQAGYLNETLLGAGDKVPERLRDDLGDGEPTWEKVSDEGVYRWHDHRVHWMSLDPPPSVAADPGSEHLVIDGWQIFAKYGDQPESTVTGELRWVPAQTAPWWVVVVVLAAAVVVLGALRRWRRPIAFAAVLVAAAAVGQWLATPLPQDEYQGSFTFVLVSAAVPALAVVGLCVLGLRALWRGAAEPTWYLLGAAGALAAIQASSDIAVLTRSQLEHSGPPWLARLCVSAAIGLGVGLFVAMMRHALRDRRAGAGRVQRRQVDIASDEEMAQMQDAAVVLGARRKHPGNAP